MSELPLTASPSRPGRFRSALPDSALPSQPGSPLVWRLNAPVGATVITGVLGVGLKPESASFGIGLTARRDAVLFLVAVSRARAILETIRDTARPKTEAGAGIVFRIDIEDVVGPNAQRSALMRELEKDMEDTRARKAAFACRMSCPAPCNPSSVRRPFAMILMTKHGVTSRAVTRRDEDDEAGLLELRDIAAQTVAKDRARERVNVCEIMSKPALTVAAAMLADNGVDPLVRLDLTRAVVADRNRDPPGMVSLRGLRLGPPD